MHYSYEDVLRRIQDRVIDRCGDVSHREQKQVYADERVHITKDAWHRKMTGETRFSFEEISRLSDFFGAPPGWPFIAWETADAIQQALDTLTTVAGRHKEAPATPSRLETVERKPHKGK